MADSTVELEQTTDVDPELRRFCVELEFVQSLANPAYLYFLAQRKYFEDAAFVRYLDYLQYWTQPPYTQFIQFPHALFFLEMLQDEGFRRSLLLIPGFHEKVLHTNQFFHWMKYRTAQHSRDSLVSEKKKDVDS